MNRQFMIKMLQAKQLEYEAFKEIMPEPMAKRVTKLETDIMEFGKEYFLTMMTDSKTESKSSGTDSRPKTRKVTIE